MSKIRAIFALPAKIAEGILSSLKLYNAILYRTIVIIIIIIINLVGQVRPSSQTRAEQWLDSRFAEQGCCCHFSGQTYFHSDMLKINKFQQISTNFPQDLYGWKEVRLAGGRFYKRLPNTDTDCGLHLYIATVVASAICYLFEIYANISTVLLKTLFLLLFSLQLFYIILHWRWKTQENVMVLGFV